MKKIFIFLTIIICSNIFAQEIEISDQIEIETQKFKDSILKIDEFSRKLDLEFAIDKFKIDKKMNLELEDDYTTAGMLQATYNAHQSYDDLLNKYYKKLLNKLEPGDKETLKEAQRNWIKFKNSDKQLNNLIAKDEYSGGGTIQQIFVASRNLDITKSRLDQIYEYLSSRFMIE